MSEDEINFFQCLLYHYFCTDSLVSQVVEPARWLSAEIVLVVRSIFETTVEFAILV